MQKVDWIINIQFSRREELGNVFICLFCLLIEHTQMNIIKEPLVTAVWSVTQAFIFVQICVYNKSNKKSSDWKFCFHLPNMKTLAAE